MKAKPKNDGHDQERIDKAEAKRIRKAENRANQIPHVVLDPQFMERPER